jgi:hypothetical protein
LVCWSSIVLEYQITKESEAGINSNFVSLATELAHGIPASHQFKMLIWMVKCGINIYMSMKLLLCSTCLK